MLGEGLLIGQGPSQLNKIREVFIVMVEANEWWTGFSVLRI